MSLSAFLAARIAEDEASAPFVFAEQYTPARVLAECAAKRAIVDVAVAQIRLAEEARGWDNWRDMAMQTLAALAAVYADHPDYDESWRP